MDYMIAIEGSTSDLAETVKEHMATGWRPQGGVAVMRYQVENDRKGYSESEWVWAQALVKGGE
jgi:hypothetical protein